MPKPRRILGVGELLWDILPGSAAASDSCASPVALLGGAPANFSVMAGRLGDHAALLSRVGCDELGRMALERLSSMPVKASFLQRDATYETGRVTVSFQDGQPLYTIHRPAAWDFLEPSDEWVRAAEAADAICFGTLAQRDPCSRKTIHALLARCASSCLRVCDVNLRPPFVSRAVLESSIECANVLKLNGGELLQVLRLLELPVADGRAEERLRAGSQRLLSEFSALTLVAITLGAHGSLLVSRDEWHTHPGVPATVADTIGSGDAFTAALVHYLLRGADLPTLNEAGNRWGAWVASQSGAMPPLPGEMRDSIAVQIARCCA